MRSRSTAGCTPRGVDLVEDQDLRHVGGADLVAAPRSPRRSARRGCEAGASTTCSSRSASAASSQRRLERRDQVVRQVADEADRVGQRRRRRAPCAGRRWRVVVSSVANSWSAAYASASRQRVEQRRLAGVGVADQRDATARRLRSRARRCVLRCRFDACSSCSLQRLDALADQAAVESRAASRPGRRAGRCRRCWRSRWVQPRTRRVARCSSCASSTCSLPSWLRARCAKMSRISSVRSTHRDARVRCSRLRCCAGDSAWSKMTQLGAGAATQRLRSRRPCRCRRRAPDRDARARAATMRDRPMRPPTRRAARARRALGVESRRRRSRRRRGWRALGESRRPRRRRSADRVRTTASAARTSGRCEVDGARRHDGGDRVLVDHLGHGVRSSTTYWSNDSIWPCSLMPLTR